MPKHAMAVLVAVAVKGVGWVSTMACVVLIPNESVTVTEYDPAGRLLAVAPVCTGVVFHAKV